MMEMLLSPMLCIPGVLQGCLLLAAPTCEFWQREVSVESQMLPKDVILREKFGMGYC